MASLAHGVPLVTTIGHLTEDFWRKTDAVAIVPALDVVAFVEKVENLLQDASEMRRMSERSRQIYDAEFDVRHVIAALREASAAS
jgi:glycosyltransferase involved in cell wall biosynthesis